MRQTLGILTIVAAALMAWPSSAAAQPNATVILASGDRVTGQLVDLNGSGIEMSVNGDTRNLPIGDVAVIDFVGGGSNIPTTETSRMQAGRTLVMLRGGDFFYGTLYDMSERDPLRITVRTPDGERQVMSNQVGRIFLRNWTGMPTGGGNGRASGRGGATQLPEFPLSGRYTLSAGEQWVNTRLMVRQGQMVRFSVEGEIQLSSDSSDIARPAGSVNGRPGGRGAPMPAESAGAFIGRIGSGRPFGIGDQTQAIPMPATGILWIGINDNTMNNNSGQYTVEVRVQ